MLPKEGIYVLRSGNVETKASMSIWTKNAQFCELLFEWAQHVHKLNISTRELALLKTIVIFTAGKFPYKPYFVQYAVHLLKLKSKIFSKGIIKVTLSKT